MLRFAANISTMYGEYDFLDRFEAAAQDGFEAVEFQFPYDFPAADIARRLAGQGLASVLFNAVAGDLKAGEKGLACLPGRSRACLDGVERALEYAVVLGTPRIHLMAGLAPAGVPRATLEGQYRENVHAAALLAAQAGVDIMLEPINPIGMPGYFLNTQQQAHDVVQALGLPNVKVQMDLFHCQIVEGDVTRKLRNYLPTGRVGHLQIAGVPDRHEPGTGELAYPYVFWVLDELGYEGWIGCEYFPAVGTRAGLGWIQPYL
ncbi:2-oxo-tetronate isomerase [Candidimonas nitroreducens]|uniref:Hydroxypyruvate isomerase n=1 Tax=Candidimonas nitroreducens TaxID=683354 RepID=A0A225MIK3_9BURK|nr:2-oxo-tetronate isomerase [Candidimonas nitroreducens]OWT60133.1 hydroxypyruvate isomerase [Candidimonas nitroreducens]